MILKGLDLVWAHVVFSIAVTVTVFERNSNCAEKFLATQYKSKSERWKKQKSIKKNELIINYLKKIPEERQKKNKKKV